jgi:hypothetical protein
MPVRFLTDAVREKLDSEALDRFFTDGWANTTVGA